MRRPSYWTMKMKPYSSCLWLRFLVTVLQAGGSFVYTWPRLQDTRGFPEHPRASCRPVFSLPLCLWALFTKLWMLAGVYLHYQEVKTFRSQQIDQYIFFSFCIVLNAVWSLAPLFLLFKSKQLSNILQNLDNLQADHTSVSLPRQTLQNTVWVLLTLLLCLTCVIYRHFLVNYNLVTFIFLGSYTAAVVFEVLVVLKLFGTLCYYIS